MVERVTVSFRCDPAVWKAFGEVCKGKRGRVLEQLISGHIGSTLADKKSQKLQMEAKAVQLQKEIANLGNVINTGEQITKERIALHWPQFRKSFTIKQDCWKGDTDGVGFFKEHGLSITFDYIFGVWDEMEGLE